jgi:hypothetical protein
MDSIAAQKKQAIQTVVTLAIEAVAAVVDCWKTLLKYSTVDASSSTSSDYI